MTQEDLKCRIERNSAVKTVSTEDGINAGLKLGELAAEKNIHWAFADGIAMHVYGYVRATVDVDVIADEVLGLESQKTLSFGGESYLVEIAEDSITVDWIVRNDENEKFYASALADAVEVRTGVRVISPDWMVIIKHLAGRPKDQLDLTCSCRKATWSTASK